MRSGQSVLTASFFCLVTLFCLGCQKQEGPGATPSTLTELNLLTIRLAYTNFCISQQTSPSNLEELAPFLVSTVFPESHRKMEEECLRQIQEGKYIVIWNQQGVADSKKGTDILVAYEQRAAEKGGFGVYADRRVEWLSREEVERASRPDKKN